MMHLSFEWGGGGEKGIVLCFFPGAYYNVLFMAGMGDGVRGNASMCFLLSFLCNA